mmetsp:Transcript_22178/g.40298  ORF Transcript_22178/g.40298 Transcript_22178/m.40298 type:complete len:142 (-) Transcript_22178:136-561(-)
MSNNSQETATLTILRTSDAAKAEITFSVNSSLNDLKQKISTNSSLGPIDPAYQRLFHLGRELKSGGRSLKSLGVGRFSNFLLHLHSTCPETCDLLSSDEEVEIVVPVPEKRPAKQNKKEIIDLLDDDSDNEQEQGKRQRVS